VLKAASLKAPTLRTRKLVLVVDDDPSMLKVIERMLKMHGFDVEVFNSVEDFEKRANLREATCLVLDINLNGKSGIDLRRRIAMSGISIPAVLITGNDNPSVRKAADDSDCSAFLVKPFPVKSLIDAITKVTPEPGRSRLD
jgi:FixJ family two-component response regulator